MTDRNERNGILAGNAAAGSAIVDALTRSEATRPLRQALAAVAGIDWGTVGRELLREIDKSFTEGLKQALQVIWKQKIERGDRRPNDDDDGVALVPLVRHRAEIGFTIPVEVRVNDLPGLALNVAATLRIDVKSAILAIERGRIAAVRMARGNVHGKLECEGVEFVDLELLDVDLAATLEL